MDTKSIGAVISRLRKNNGWTQQVLAERLGVTDKAVSKWESGQGYPDITLFPVMSELFGVSLDYLMLGEENGIAVAGTTLVDIVKTIDRYPESGMLANITDIGQSVGGCAPNVAINIAKIDRRVPVSVIAKVGTDDNGRYIVSTLQKYGVNINHISYTSTTPTSFTDVMSVPSGERTFFHKKGANSEFGPDDIDIDSLGCNILHIGYIYLMDIFDADDKQYGTVLARFLDKVQKRGIKTSIDMVSDSSGNYKEKVVPVLKYCDYVIINEIECCGIWGLAARRPDGSYNRENIRLAMQKTIDSGVRERVIVHCKEACFSLDSKYRFVEVPSVKVPKAEIRGSVGAGDAFCAACLYSIYNSYGDLQMLEFASAAAACNLLEANSVDGMKPRNEILSFAQRCGRHEIAQ